MVSKKSKRFPVSSLGLGIGMRPVHYQEILKSKPPIDWFEIISENFLMESGKPLEYLEKILEHYPIVQHGVSLSIGSTDPLNWDYLKKLKKLAERTKTPWISDHLCWCKYNAHYMHNLMPVPYSKVVGDLIAEKAKTVQDYLERPFLLENVSSYVGFQSSQMTEWEFLSYVAEKADCGILLDINNIYVSAFNHHFDPVDYLKGIPMERVLQIHLAGHDDKGSYILDSHDHPVRKEVWELYQKAIPFLGEVSILLERDANIPPLKEMVQELQQVKHYQKVLENA